MHLPALRLWCETAKDQEMTDTKDNGIEARWTRTVEWLDSAHLRSLYASHRIVAFARREADRRELETLRRWEHRLGAAAEPTIRELEAKLAESDEAKL
jgi:hypothetical protein